MAVITPNQCRITTSEKEHNMFVKFVLCVLLAALVVTIFAVIIFINELLSK